MSPSSPSLRTPTVELPVTVALRGAGPTPAALFLPERPRRHRSQLLDDVRELLEHDREFLPMQLGAARSLVARAAIDYVIVPRGASEPFAQEEPSDVHALYDQQRAVEITLHHGEVLSGTLLFSSTADRARLLDFLGGGPRFFALWRADALLLVARAAIRLVTEIEAT